MGYCDGVTNHAHHETDARHTGARRSGVHDLPVDWDHDVDVMQRRHVPGAVTPWRRKLDHPIVLHLEEPRESGRCEHRITAERCVQGRRSSCGNAKDGANANIVVIIIRRDIHLTTFDRAIDDQILNKNALPNALVTVKALRDLQGNIVRRCRAGYGRPYRGQSSVVFLQFG